MTRTRPAGIGVVLLLALLCSGCGGSSAKRRTTTGRHAVTVLFARAPDSLDPQSGSLTQSAEPDWIAYTGLTTYAHSSGLAGGQLIPGLTTTLPLVSADGKTYTATLRRGLVFSNGQPVKASDFSWTVERAIKLAWRGAPQFLLGQIVGAKAFASGKAKTISGITADDARRKITIHLTESYGPFENVLAFPALGLVPAGTPFRDMPGSPPPGVGPYVIKNVEPGASYSLVPNPLWAQMRIPAIPAAHAEVDAKIASDVKANAQAVLDNRADVFDWADEIPASLLATVASSARRRYTRVVLNSTDYFFMNTHARPFSSELARRAVVTGLDKGAISRLDSDRLVTGCFYLPPGMTGHPSSQCPYGNPPTPDLAKARQLVRESRMAGTRVTVWGEPGSPRREWVDYYTSFLNQIGFKATEKIVPETSYFATIGELKRGAQTGFDDWNQDFPNPIDFYSQLESSSIIATGNQNQGLIRDAHIDGETAALGKLPTSSLPLVARRWERLDQYTAQRAYVAVFGYPTFPAFTSSRIDYSAIVFSPVYGWDWTSFQLR